MTLLGNRSTDFIYPAMADPGYRAYLVREYIFVRSWELRSCGLSELELVPGFVYNRVVYGAVLCVVVCRCLCICFVVCLCVCLLKKTG